MKLTVQQPDAREIKVKLLLAGGQSAMLVVAPGHPLLAQLLAAVAATDGAEDRGRPPCFRFRWRAGERRWRFPPSSLSA